MATTEPSVYVVMGRNGVVPFAEVFAARDDALVFAGQTLGGWAQYAEVVPDLHYRLLRIALPTDEADLWRIRNDYCDTVSFDDEIDLVTGTLHGTLKGVQP